MTPPPHLSGNRPRGSVAGRFIPSYYHTPVGSLKMLCQKGVVPYFTEYFGETNMRRAATKLPAENRPPQSNLPTSIAFLTGSKYWHETLFCIRSLLRVTPESPPIRIISDGSLSDQHIAIYQHQRP